MHAHVMHAHAHVIIQFQFQASNRSSKNYKEDEVSHVLMSSS